MKGGRKAAEESCFEHDFYQVYNADVWIDDRKKLLAISKGIHFHNKGFTSPATVLKKVVHCGSASHTWNVKQWQKRMGYNFFPKKKNPT